MTNNPIITVKGAPENRNVQTKQGVKTVYYQPAQFENEQLRMNIDLEIDAVADAYPINTKLEWDVAADLVAGQYGRVELARKKTLRPITETKPAKAA